MLARTAAALLGEESARPGRPRRDIADLTRLEVTGLERGSTVLSFALAGHGRPLGELDLGVKALEILEDGFVALATGAAMPLAWDSGVRSAIEQFTRVFDKGIDSIVVERVGGTPRRAKVTKAVRDRLLTETAPIEHRHIEVEGRLLMADFAPTRDQARIHVPLGPPVRCAFAPGLEDSVLRLLRHYVRATGEAEIDESGNVKLLRLETLEDAEPTGRRSFWELPSLDALAREQRVQPVGRIEELADGTWPEDESVDDFLAAIESRD